MTAFMKISLVIFSLVSTLSTAAAADTTVRNSEQTSRNVTSFDKSCHTNLTSLSYSDRNSLVN